MLRFSALWNNFIYGKPQFYNGRFKSWLKVSDVTSRSRCPAHFRRRWGDLWLRHYPARWIFWKYASCIEKDKDIGLREILGGKDAAEEFERSVFQKHPQKKSQRGIVCRSSWTVFQPSLPSFQFRARCDQQTNTVDTTENFVIIIHLKYINLLHIQHVQISFWVEFINKPSIDFIYFIWGILI